MYKKNDKYIQAVANLYEEEFEKLNENKEQKRKTIWIKKRKKKINYN